MKELWNCIFSKKCGKYHFSADDSSWPNDVIMCYVSTCEFYKSQHAGYSRSAHVQRKIYIHTQSLLTNNSASSDSRYWEVFRLCRGIVWEDSLSRELPAYPKQTANTWNKIVCFYLWIPENWNSLRLGKLRIYSRLLASYTRSHVTPDEQNRNKSTESRITMKFKW